MVIVSKASKKNTRDADYIFNKYSDFKALAAVLLCPIVGLFRINLTTDKIADIEELLKEQSLYEHLDIAVYTVERNLDILYMRHPGISNILDSSPFDVFKELVTKHNLLFDKKALYSLYGNIEHSNSEMEEALALLEDKFGKYNEITERYLQQYFPIQNIVYPREVLIAYLWMSKYRDAKLDKCVKQLGNDVCFRATIKNLKKFVEDKATYYTSGKASKLIKLIPEPNLIKLYKLFVLDKKFTDAKVLYAMYERGEIIDLL